MKRSMILPGILTLCIMTSGAAGQASAPAEEAVQPPEQATQPARAGATLAIRALQGTKDGPKIGAEGVVVELFRDGGQPEKIETRLDEHGVAILENLSLDRPFQPRVTVRHGDVGYHAVGKTMDAAHPEQQVTVTVYETTEQRPAWTVQMRHIILHPSDNGLHVTETIAVHNPADRLWLGSPSAMGLRTTLELDLPRGARGINMGAGFDARSTRIIASRVIHTGALQPGRSLFRLGYTVPTHDGHAQLVVVAPAPVERLVVFAPGQDPDLHSEDLEKGEVYSVKGKAMRLYQKTNVAAGAKLALTLGSTMHHPHPQPDQSKDESLHRSRMLAGAGGGAILVVALAVLVIRRPRKNEPRARQA